MMPVRPLVFGAVLVLVQLLAGADASSSGGGVEPTGSLSAASSARPVSFRRDVAPVLAVSCTTVSCHGGGSRPPVLPTSGDFREMRGALVGVASEDRPGFAYVQPGDPDASYVVQKLEGQLIDGQCTEHDCGARMPLDNPPLAPEDLAAVRSWIAQGALDN
jgi:hypothetical protein